jgi:hypothetical protein
MGLHSALGKFGIGPQVDGFRSRAQPVLEIGELSLPVMALPMKQSRQIEKLRVAHAIVEPKNREGLILPAVPAPIAQRALGQGALLVVKIAGENW